MIGAAIRDDLIDSIDDPITRYIPELKSAPAFDGVTLRHLITMSSGLRFNENDDPNSDMGMADGGQVIAGRPPIVSYAMKLRRAHRPGTVEQYETINFDLLGITLSRVLEGRTVSDYLSEKIWRPAGAMLPAGWIDNAHKPVWPVTDNGSGYGWGWWVRQDGGYEAVGAYGQSVTIYPKDDVVIAVNAASRDPHGFGIARWRLLQALDAAAVGRPDPNDKAK